MASWAIHAPIKPASRRAAPLLAPRRAGAASCHPAAAGAVQRRTFAAAAQQPQLPQPCGSAAQQDSSSIPSPRSTLSWRVLRGACLCGAAVALSAALPAAAQAAQAAAGSTGSSFLKSALDFVLHLDVHLGDIVAKFGVKTYWILFAIVFAETGLVVTPFLPGDSLLFATGALAALGKLSLPLLVGCYVVAATLGDAVNYAVGNYLGAAAFKSRLLKREHIAKTEEFYDKFGGKTVVLARFVPIVRTFAPFVAGVGSMSYGQFAVYNVAGAVLWTAVCVGAGYAFGNVPAVHENFSLVVLGIVVVSVLPIAWELFAAKKEAAPAAAAPAAVPHSTPAAAAAAISAADPPRQPPAVAAAAASAADKAKQVIEAAGGTAAADPLEQLRVAECEKDPSSPECRVYDD